MTQSEILDKIIQDIIEDYQEKPVEIKESVKKIRELNFKYWNNWWEADTEFEEFENYLKIYYPQYYKELI